MRPARGTPPADGGGITDRSRCFQSGMTGPVAFPNGTHHTSCWKPNRGMKAKTDVPQGTLALMVLKTLDVLGPLHGYGIARRIEQISGDLLSVNQGTLYHSNTSRRVNEVGVRMALGATRPSVVALILQGAFILI